MIRDINSDENHKPIDESARFILSKEELDNYEKKSAELIAAKEFLLTFIRLPKETRLQQTIQLNKALSCLKLQQTFFPLTGISIENAFNKQFEPNEKNRYRLKQYVLWQAQMFLINATYKPHVVKVPFLDEIIDDISIQACSALKISALTKKELASFTTIMIITAYKTQIALTQQASVKFQAEIASRENLSAHVVALIAQIVQIARSFFPNRSQKKDANTSSATPQSYFTGQVPMIKQESSLSLQNIKTFEQKSLIQNSPPKIHPKKTKPHQIRKND